MTTETKLEMVEQLMRLMTTHRVNKVTVDGIALEVVHFQAPPPTPEQLKEMEELRRRDQEELALWSAQQ